MSRISAHVYFKNGERWSSLTQTYSDLLNCLVHNNITVHVFEENQYVVQPYKFLSSYETKSLADLLNYLYDVNLLENLRFEIVGYDITLGI